MQCKLQQVTVVACKEIFIGGVFANLKPQIFYHFEEEERGGGICQSFSFDIFLIFNLTCQGQSAPGLCSWLGQNNDPFSRWPLETLFSGLPAVLSCES